MPADAGGELLLMKFHSFQARAASLETQVPDERLHP
jgi:hypothetical protein